MVCHMLERLRSWHAEQRQRCQRCLLASPNFRHGCDRVLRPCQHFDFFKVKILMNCYMLKRFSG